MAIDWLNLRLRRRQDMTFSSSRVAATGLRLGLNKLSHPWAATIAAVSASVTATVRDWLRWLDTRSERSEGRNGLLLCLNLLTRWRLHQLREGLVRDIRLLLIVATRMLRSRGFVFGAARMNARSLHRCARRSGARGRLTDISLTATSRRTVHAHIDRRHCDVVTTEWL